MTIRMTTRDISDICLLRFGGVFYSSCCKRKPESGRVPWGVTLPGVPVRSKYSSNVGARDSNRHTKATTRLMIGTSRLSVRQGRQQPQGRCHRDATGKSKSRALTFVRRLVGGKCSATHRVAPPPRQPATIRAKLRPNLVGSVVNMTIFSFKFLRACLKK